jgi:hypothetical protein
MIKEANTAKQYANLMFNPFSIGNLPQTAGDSKTTTMAKHALGLTVGYGGIGLLARYAKHLKDKAQSTKSDERMKAFIGAHNPIVSLDPSTRDTKREEKERGIGVQETTEEVGLRKEADGAEYMKQLQRGKQHAMHPAVAIAAALAGGLGGYSLMDRKLDTDRNEDLEDQIETDENKIDKLLYEEYIKSRGLDKTAEEDWITAGGHTYSSGKLPASEGTTLAGNAMDIVGDPAQGWSLAKSTMGLVAMGLMALSYKASRNYMDENDPNRQRMKQLRSVIEEKGKVRSAPIFSDLSEFPEAPAKAKKTSSGTSLQRKSETKNPIKSATPADESDPYANLLAQG